MTTLIFDCDGVLADTEADGHLVAFNEAFAEFGLTTRWSRSEYGHLLHIGGGKERLRTLLADRSLDPALPQDPAGDDDFIARLHRRKTERFIDIVTSGRLPPRPGVRRIIRQALQADWTIAVASTSAESSVRAVLQAAAGSDAPRIAVFAGDIVDAKKPAPDIYLHALDRTGADPADTVVIEDSQIGAAAAAAAGLRHLITVSSYTADDHFPHASVVATSLGDDAVPGRVLNDRIGSAGYPIQLELLGRVATEPPR